MNTERIAFIECSPSGFYAECFGEDCDWWGPLEQCWSPDEDPESFRCGSCMRPIKSVWHAEERKQ